jgi:hypothetical protein
LRVIERAILFGLPALCGLAIAFVLYGPGAERVVTAARVYGVPVVGATRFAFRLEVVDHYRGLLQPSAGELFLEVRHQGRKLGDWGGVSDADGFADAVGELDESLPFDASIELVRRGRTILGAAMVALPALELEQTARCETGVGTVALRLCLRRGVAVPELPERVDVDIEVARRDGALEAELDPRATGGDLGEVEGPSVPRCDQERCLVRYWFQVTARAPTLALDLVARVGEQGGEYHGELPLQPGGIWLDPARSGRTLTLRSATPKPAAYLSLLATTGRVWGAAVALTSDEHGFGRGSVELPAPFEGEPLTLMVSSEPTEPESRTVAWPLSPSELRPRPVRLQRLVDGVPRAIALEQRRMRASRWPVVGVILASAVAVLLQLLVRVRRSRQDLRQHLERRGGAQEVAEVPLGLPIVVAAALALAFAILAAVAAYG